MIMMIEMLRKRTMLRKRKMMIIIIIDDNDDRDVEEEESDDDVNDDDNNHDDDGYVRCKPGGPRSREAIVKLLLDNGADPNEADYHGFTPIHFSSIWGT